VTVTYTAYLDELAVKKDVAKTIKAKLVEKANKQMASEQTSIISSEVL
jgi:hypothetical protein